MPIPQKTHIAVTIAVPLATGRLKAPEIDHRSESCQPFLMEGTTKRESNQWASFPWLHRGEAKHKDLSNTHSPKPVSSKLAGLGHFGRASRTMFGTDGTTSPHDLSNLITGGGNKMTRKRIALIGIVCSLLLMASLAAWGVESGAFSAGKGPFDGSLKRLIVGQVGRVLVLKSQLDVTDEQKEKTAGIIKSRLDEIIPVAKNVVEKRRALRQAVMKEEPNEKEIRAAAEALGKSLGDASVLTSKIVAEARPIFTPHQVKLVQDFRISLDNATTDWLNQLGKK